MIDTAYAAITSTGPAINISQAYEIQDVVQTSVAVLVLVSGMLCVFYILWGGVMLILSGGKEDKIKPAISGIRFSVIGLIVIIIALFVLPKIGDLLGLNVSHYISPRVVFTTIKSLAAKLFGAPADVGIPVQLDGKPTLPTDFSDL